MKNFGEFFNDQIENAGCIVLSHTGTCSDSKIADAVALIREHNPGAVIVTTDWAQLDGKAILEAMERKDTLEAELKRLAEMDLKEEEEEEEEEHGHHHHHHHDDDDDDDHEHHHHHHHHPEGECDDPECECHHHHHHHADDVFTSWGVETSRKFTEAEIAGALAKLTDAEAYGDVLRAKGIVEAEDGGWIHFDYVPGEPDIRRGSAGVTGRLCVIGAKIKEPALAGLFGL